MALAATNFLSTPLEDLPIRPGRFSIFTGFFLWTTTLACYYEWYIIDSQRSKINISIPSHKSMKTERLVSGVLLGALLGALFTIIFVGINKSEATECLTWQAQAKEFKGFYLTGWQKMQCDAQNIQIDAPVR